MFVVVGALACLFALSPGFAFQPPKKAGKSASKRKKSPTKTKKKFPKKKSVRPKISSGTAKKTGTASPPPVQVKQLPEMKINKPLMSKGELVKLDRKLRKAKYKRILSAGVLNGKAKSIIQDWARWRIAEMTLPENRNQLYELRSQIRRDVQISASLLNRNLAADQIEEFRRFVCGELTKRCVEVLDNNFFVRLQVVLILGHLDLMEYDARNRTLPVSYAPAAEVLLEKVLVADQPVAIKSQGANGGKRLALLSRYDARTSVARNRKLAAGLISEFEKTDTHPWYQSRLAEALAAVDLRTNPEGHAVIVQALAEVMVDNANKRKPEVRCESAKALGRAPLATDVNVDLLAFEIVQLTKDMANRYNKELAAVNAKNAQRANMPQKNQVEEAHLPAHWPLSFLKIYFAFQPTGSLEKKLYNTRRLPADRTPGLKMKFPKRASVDSAYKTIKPIVRHVAEQTGTSSPAPIPANDIATLTTWLNTNKPSSFRVQGGLAPLRVMKAALAKPMGGNNGVAGP